MLLDYVGVTNSSLPVKYLEEIAAPDEKGRNILNQAADKFKLSARGYHRILRVARTLADLEGADNVGYTHIAEAIGYRQMSVSGMAA